jgi:hypothetical protein
MTKSNYSDFFLKILIVNKSNVEGNWTKKIYSISTCISNNSDVTNFKGYTLVMFQTYKAFTSLGYHRMRLYCTYIYMYCTYV